MVLNAATGAATLYLPPQTAGEIRALGKNWLTDPELGKPWGFTAIRPLDELPGVLARVSGSAEPLLWLRLQAGDESDINRGEHATDLSRRLVNVGGTHLTEDASRVAYFRAHFPLCRFPTSRPSSTACAPSRARGRSRCCAPTGASAPKPSGAPSWRRARTASSTRSRLSHLLDVSQRRAGQLVRADRGSGPNVNVWHYATNGRQYKDGDLVVMDYGGALDYLGVDITRTWPVSGQFTPDQLKAYQCALEAQKAIIAAMTVGATRAQTREIGQAIYKKYGFPGGAGAGTTSV